jgi:hypothetical protein
MTENQVENLLDDLKEDYSTDWEDEPLGSDSVTSNTSVSSETYSTSDPVDDSNDYDLDPGWEGFEDVPEVKWDPDSQENDWKDFEDMDIPEVKWSPDSRENSTGDDHWETTGSAFETG